MARVTPLAVLSAWAGNYITLVGAAPFNQFSHRRKPSPTPRSPQCCIGRTYDELSGAAQRHSNAWRERGAADSAVASAYGVDLRKKDPRADERDDQTGNEIA
jgi:hypothetical protein